MPMHNVIEYSDVYSKTSGCLWQYYRDEPALDNNDNITDLEMSLNNCKINLQLKWSDKCILFAGTAPNQEPDFEITDTKLYVPVVTLSTQYDIKLCKQLESCFKRTINWNKYHSKTTNQAQNF